MLAQALEGEEEMVTGGEAGKEKTRAQVRRLQVAATCMHEDQARTQAGSSARGVLEPLLLGRHGVPGDNNDDPARESATSLSTASTSVSASPTPPPHQIDTTKLPFLEGYVKQVVHLRSRPPLWQPIFRFGVPSSCARLLLSTQSGTPV